MLASTSENMLLTQSRELEYYCTWTIPLPSSFTEGEMSCEHMHLTRKEGNGASRLTVCMCACVHVCADMCEGVCTYVCACVAAYVCVCGVCIHIHCKHCVAYIYLCLY